MSNSFIADPSYSTRLSRAFTILTLSFVLAMASAIGHLAYVFARRSAGAILFVSDEIVWMAPLGSLLVFGLPAALLATGTLIHPRLVSMRVATFCLVSLFAFSLLIEFKTIWPVAWILVAIGIGIRTSAGLAALSSRQMRRFGMGALVVATLLGGIGLAQRALQVRAEARGLAALPPATPGAPNVVLVILDTVRATSLSLYGYERETTPYLDGWAKDAVVFDWAFSTAPWTLPSHAGMFTGQYASNQTGEWTTPLDDTHRTLAESLRGAGYATGGFVANTLFTSWESGLDRGFIHYDDYITSVRQAWLSTTIGQAELVQKLIAAIRNGAGAARVWKVVSQMQWFPQFGQYRNQPKSAALVHQQFLEWQGTLGRRPFFAFLNLFDAHAPYVTPHQFSNRYDNGATSQDRYDGAIAYLDMELSRLFATLQQRGVLQNTIVVITSDHGEQFGEHDLGSHANSLYLPLLRVPLMVHYPAKLPGGLRVDHPVSLRDLPATILDLAGVPSTGIPGTTLNKSWESAERRKGLSVVIAEVSKGVNDKPENRTYRGNMKSTLDSAWHYIRNGDGVEELYAYRRDPNEELDHATSAAGRMMLPVYRARIARALEEKSPGQR